MQPFIESGASTAPPSTDLAKRTIELTNLAQEFAALGLELEMWGMPGRSLRDFHKLHCGMLQGLNRSNQSHTGSESLERRREAAANSEEIETRISYFMLQTEDRKGLVELKCGTVQALIQTVRITISLFRSIASCANNRDCRSTACSPAKTTPSTIEQLKPPYAWPNLRVETVRT
jgi:hypothetical protein